MVAAVIYRMVYYLTEGAVFVLSPWFCVTRFFGYPVKKSESRKKLFFFLICGYAFFSTILNTWAFGASLSEEKTINGFLALFLFVYFLLQIRRRKGEAFLVTLVSFEMLSVPLSMVFFMEKLFQEVWHGGKWFEAWIELLALFLLLFVIALFSVFSARRRKAPMPVSLVVSVFLLLLLTDNLLVFLYPEEYLEHQPVVSVRLFLNLKESDLFHRVLSLFVVLLLLLCFFLFVIKASEAIYLRNENAMSRYYWRIQKEHMEGVLESDRRIRKIKHDMKNHVYVMEKLLEEKSYEDLQRYLEQLSGQIKSADRDLHTGNEIADAILSEKKRRAEDLHIRFQVEGSFPGEVFDELDICVLLGNMADNAIEAVKDLEEPERHLKISFRQNEHFLFICEKNPVSHPLEIRDNRISTSKKDREEHGFGLMNIMDTVEKYAGECVIASEKEKEADFFVIEIMIPKVDCEKL
ncbi:MAG: sensor histidine kinase [Lachnospiraceae bacterium]|nr:sensor histidine kinase [Lachnospiraceae bacterium]